MARTEDKSDNRRVPTWPQFVNGNKAICRWVNRLGDFQVFLISRSDGMFGRWGEFFSDDPEELCFVPNDMGGSFYDSEVSAINEIHSIYPWTREVALERAD